MYNNFINIEEKFKPHEINKGFKYCITVVINKKIILSNMISEKVE